MTRKNDSGSAADAITRPASEESIPDLVDFVRRTATGCGYQDDTIEDLGRATEEAALNIIRFACRGMQAEIGVMCLVHENGALYITITDTGAPFNMLLAGTFPETDDFFGPGQKPSTKIMKKAARNIEYKRNADKNILIFTVSHDPGGIIRKG
ncbi:MAG: ATP-binding protein [Syntrophorhabdaceae bacterium]|nr:ATP-binding protein [Syntrophorhabdaceae bacterium]MDD4196131.1 ATP-binding protein [Syntrophorhabdaceae bacterium]HOC45379.1 ATP-binding protein [Syntrophorhabdaceae bacterium]